MFQSPDVATVHALASLAVGIYWAVQKGHPERVAYAAAYVAGAEVLWRMCAASVFWEFGKYAIAAIFLVAILRIPKFKRHDLSTLYFALLLPSILLTIESMDFHEWRQEISFNLAGPFALMISVWFFSNVRLSAAKLRRVFVAYLGPVAGVAAITVSATYGGGHIRFSDNSNFAASGGFGPNQVSAILGLGALFAFIGLMQGSKTGFGTKLLFAAAMAVCAVQSAMTFSRGGVYCFAAAALIASFFLLRQPRQRTRFAIVIAMAFVLVRFLIVPGLDSFTGGAFSRRMTESKLTHRDELVKADLEIWAEHPIFGAGPGVSRTSRARLSGASSIAHTEFTRLLSDHGVLGLLALVPLLLTCLERFRKAQSPAARALVVSMIAWTLLYMLINAMRLAAPSFLFGLACVTLIPERRYFLLVETASAA